MDNPIVKKLEALIKLQNVDSQLDEIKKVRGDLPEEVQDLEDEIEGYQTRIKKFESECDLLKDEIKNLRTAIKDSERLIEKYEKQQNDVRNNREFDALAKEIELQDLEIRICNKKIREVEERIDKKEGMIGDTKETMVERQKDLDNKRTELEVILKENEEDERKLLKDRERRTKQVEPRLLHAYNRLRKGSRNGLAVVSVERHACGGCFNIVPLQRQAEVKDRKKIIVCEHCGRIFANVIDVIEEEAPKRKTRRKSTRKKRTTTRTTKKRATRTRAKK